VSRLPTWLPWALGTGAALLAIRAVTRGGIVAGGRVPTRGQSYLFERTPTHLHRGIDVGAPAGSPVYAAGPGKVAAVWPDGRVSGYGNTVVLQHPDGSQTLYAHLSGFAPGLSVGKRVGRLEPIGTVGVTQAPRPPMTSKPHLHFEAHRRHTLAIREDNPARFDPMVYLRARNLSVTA